MKTSSAISLTMALTLNIGYTLPANSAEIALPKSFDSMDKNKDFYVKEDEVKAAAPELNFEAADSNHDGSLSRVEYSIVQEQIAAGKWTNAAAKEGEVDPDSIKGSSKDPVEVVEKAKKGSLKNPYDPADKKVAAAGHQVFMDNGCSGCHGGTGGGGMGPALSNTKWVYGYEDDTIFRLITLGSAGLQKQGFTRVAAESVVGPMPQQGGVTVKTEGDVWKIITWIKSLHQ